jgi:subtilisin family serine protease
LRNVLFSFCFIASGLATVATPADAAPRWRAYPNGQGEVFARLSKEYLLVAPRPELGLDTLAEYVAKAAPGGALAEMRTLVRGRVVLRIRGLKDEDLVALGARLQSDGVVTGAWPALERNGGVIFSDDAVALSTETAPTTAVLEKFGLEFEGASTLPGVYRARALDGDGVGAARRARALPGVRWAEPDLIRDVKLLAIPNDPELAAQWHLENEAGVGDIDAQAAWATTTGDPSVVIGIFDTGTDLDHPDLVTNIVGGFDAADNDDDAEAECGASQDGAGPSRNCPGNAPFRESHGTAVAGLSAARGSNDLHGAGVCPDCALYPVRLIAEGNGFRSLGNAETFRRAAEAGLSVINNSWGPNLSRFFPLSEAERESFDFVTRDARDGRGVVVLFAAGNDFFTPATSNPYASYPDHMTVSASTRTDDFACYSDYGDVIAIAAPSQGCFDGESGIATTDYVGSDGYAGGDFTNGFGGTSAASPIAAGLAGLVLSANPNLTAQQVKLVMQMSADKIIADKNPWEARYGVNLAEEFAYDEHGFSQGFGYGRINAATAVRVARENPPQVAGVCDDLCPRCFEGRCAPACVEDAECPGAARCIDVGEGTLGCAIPRPAPTAAGEPCGMDCAACVPSIDSAFEQVEICTTTCEDDTGCPFGFDCRAVDDDPSVPKLCIPGSKECGLPFDDVRCFSNVAVSGGGTTYCSCECLPDSPGACPEGFVCSPALCQQRDQQTIECEGTSENRANYFPVCVPDPNFRRPCESHGDCGAALFCIDGQCAPDQEPGGCDACITCTRDNDCAAGESCVDTTRGLHCLPSCRRDADCPGSMLCVNIPGPADFHCVNDNFQTKGICPRSWRCEVPGRCFSEDDCADGVACTDRVCEDFSEVDAGAPDAAPADATPAEVDAGPADAAPVDSEDAGPGEADALIEPDADTDDDGSERSSNSGGCTSRPGRPATTFLAPVLLGLLGAALRQRRRGKRATISASSTR